MRFDSVRDVVEQLSGLDKAVVVGCDWLIDVAQVKTDALTIEENRIGHRHSSWRGAIRGEYSLAEKAWWFFCPLWHTGQAVKALAMASQKVGGDRCLAAARLGAEFLLQNRVRGGSDSGLLLAYEDYPDVVNVSAVLESLDGLFLLSEVTNRSQYRDAALAALAWCRDRAWEKGTGLLMDFYDPARGQFVDRSLRPDQKSFGRPLADDGVWLTGHALSGERSFRDVFFDVMEQLLIAERPAGNWIDYGPCNAASGHIHPRHAYWWGLPMLSAWRETGEDRWLLAACRAGDWYRQALRADGGIFRNTDLSFNTTSFDHATSGGLCAAILWMSLYGATSDVRWLEPIYKSVEFAMSMQLVSSSDENANGAVIEQLLPPDGSGRNPYHIRDLATIFFVQAGVRLLEMANTENVHAAKQVFPVRAIAGIESGDVHNADEAANAGRVAPRRPARVSRK